jgi:hypothetical protein
VLSATSASMWRLARLTFNLGFCITVVSFMPDSKDEKKPEDDPEFMRVVKHFLKTPPKPHSEGVKGSLTESDQKKKPDGAPAKKHRPEND